MQRNSSQEHLLKASRALAVTTGQGSLCFDRDIVWINQEKMTSAASSPGLGALRGMSAEGNSVHPMFKDKSFFCCLYSSTANLLFCSESVLFCWTSKLKCHLEKNVSGDSKGQNHRTTEWLSDRTRGNGFKLKNKFFLLSDLNLTSFSLKLFPQVLSLSDCVKSHSPPFL